MALQNVGCSVKACTALDVLLSPPVLALRRLHLYNNMSGDEGAQAIARVLQRCPHMADFKMASSRVGEEGGVAIANALAKSACRVFSGVTCGVGGREGGRKGVAMAGIEGWVDGGAQEGRA